MPGTLRYCVETVGNADGVPTTVVFAIPRRGPHVIRLDHQLWIDESGTVVDGFTQAGSSPPSGQTGEGVYQIILDGSRNYAEDELST